MKIKSLPEKPPKGQRSCTPEYMRWYRHAKKHGLDTSPPKRTPEEKRAARREYEKLYARRRRRAAKRRMVGGRADLCAE